MLGTILLTLILSYIAIACFYYAGLKRSKDIANLAMSHTGVPWEKTKKEDVIIALIASVGWLPLLIWTQIVKLRTRHKYRPNCHLA